MPKYINQLFLMKSIHYLCELKILKIHRVNLCNLVTENVSFVDFMKGYIVREAVNRSMFGC